MYDSSWEAMYRAPSSDSTVDDMAFFMICAMVSMEPFFGRNNVLFGNKKWIPARLHASGLLRYLTSLFVASVIWMREYVRKASSWVAT